MPVTSGHHVIICGRRRKVLIFLFVKKSLFTTMQCVGSLTLPLSTLLLKLELMVAHASIAPMTHEDDDQKGATHDKMSCA